METRVDIIRLEMTEAFGTFGAIRINGEVFGFTLEPPDRNNKVNVSSIPAGRYRCKKTHSRKFGETYEVMNVPGRTHILFHAGNVKKDTAGCILLGASVGKLKNPVETRAVLNSGATFERFMQELSALEAQEFMLAIMEDYS